MPFPDHIKLSAKVSAAFRCCVCHKKFVEVHHLIPEAEGGPDTLENAAPLCASCHDLFGGNPEKRKQLRQMRDAWWAQMEERRGKLLDPLETEVPFEIREELNFAGGISRGRDLLYDRVYAQEDFETCAHRLVKLVRDCQKLGPNRERILALDIEGHRKRDGEFDSDMVALNIFIGTFLIQFLSEANTPLIHVRNKKWQNNEVPNSVIFFEELDGQAIREAIERGVEGIWLPGEGMIRLPKREKRRRKRRDTSERVTPSRVATSRCKVPRKEQHRRNRR
jgi:hypothetical protein